MESIKVSIRMDKDIKEQADKLFKDLGLNMSTAFNMFVRQSIRDQGIPFKIEMGNIPNGLTLEAMKEAESGQLKSFDSVDDFMKDLNN